MRTVIRDANGKIQYVRGEGNYFLSIKDRDILLDTEITVEMIQKTFGENSLNIFAHIINGNGSVEMMKIRILNTNGYTIVIKENPDK